jgi:hypothetical protein
MNSFEYVYGRRWKELYEYENKRRQELEAELREQRRRLDADMEVAYEDYKAELLREGLVNGFRIIWMGKFDIWQYLQFCWLIRISHIIKFPNRKITKLFQNSK